MIIRKARPSVFARGMIGISLGAALLVGSSPGRAQEAAATPSPAIRSANAATDSVDAFPSAADADFNDTDWRFVGRLSLVATYDDNVFIQPRDAQDDYVFHVAPTLAYGIGHFRSEVAPFAPFPHLLARTGEEELPRKNFAYASYTPDAVFFSRFHDENAVNHDVRLAGRDETELWSLQGRLRFRRVTDANLDVGRRLRQTYYSTDVRGSYQLTGKIAGVLGVAADRGEFSSGFTWTDMRGTGAVDYQIAPKVLLGLGATVGYLAAQSSADQTYQQPLLRLTYQPTAKLSFTGEAGEEFRQFKSTLPNRSRFVFALSGGYLPRDGTTLGISSRRQTQTSAQFAGENIVEDRYEGNLRQRLYRRYYFGLGAGFVRNQYEANRESATFTAQRRDHYYYGRASLSRDVTRRGTIELNYEYRENDSNVSSFGFRENVASLSASVLF